MAENYVGEFYVPYFNKDVPLYFCFDHDDATPADNEIEEYKNTLKEFVEKIDDIIHQIKEETFEYYKNHREPHYETEKHLINNCNEHFELIKDLLSIKVQKNNKIVLRIRYGADRKHGIEILLKSSKVYSIVEIDETPFLNKLGDTKEINHQDSHEGMEVLPKVDRVKIDFATGTVTLRMAKDKNE